MSEANVFCVSDQVATCVVISPDSSTMACGFADCTVRLYRLDTSKVCEQFDKVNFLNINMMYSCFIVPSVL